MSEPIAEIHDKARAELDALEAGLPTKGRMLSTWGLRVVIMGIVLFAILKWQGDSMGLLLPVVGIYAAVSFAVSYFAMSAQGKLFEKKRALVEAELSKAAGGGAHDT